MGHRPIPKVLIKTGSKCNNGCMFCHARDGRETRDLRREEIESKIEESRRRGAGMVVFSGGEPTIRKDFFDLLESARKLGLEIGVCSNGRMFSYPRFTERFLEFNPRYVYVSLHGHDRRIHNRLVRQEAFDQTCAGLKNLAGRVRELTVNVVLTKANVKELGEIVRLSGAWAPVRLKFSLLEPKGWALRYFDELAVEPSDAARAAVDACPPPAAVGRPDVDVVLDGFPYCLLGGFPDPQCDLSTDQFLWMSEAEEPDLHSVDLGEREYLPECSECSHYGLCPGVYSGYVRRGLTRDISPIRTRCPNSFPYVPDGVSVFLKDGACPIGIRNQPKPYHPDRHLFVIHQNEARLYFSPTRDFPDHHLRRTKSILQQVYQTEGASSVGLNFREDLGWLRLSPACRECTEREACPGVYAANRESPFSQSDSDLESIVSRCRGRVCDIGCGAVPFGEVIRRRVLSGEIDWIGIDPNGVSGSTELPILPYPFEDFQAPSSSFDHVWMLRSYNHVEDLARCLKKAADLLKPGGRLLMADNLAYGVVLPGTATSGGDYEHYRNHSSAECLVALKGLPFEVREHRPVGPSNGNEWRVWAERV